jgi:hypothetical protein
MNFYLVFDHYYSGIIQSQVIDVVESLENETNEKFTIIAFVNLRRFIDARAKYKAHAQRVVVLPNFGFSRWHWSIIFLVPVALLKKPRITIGRSVFANQLALILRKYRLTKEVVLDARGAEFAEWSEYFFKTDNGPISLNNLRKMELHSVQKSLRVLAVSSKLVEYWKNQLNASFDLNKVKVVPSSMSRIFETNKIDIELASRIRLELNISEENVLLVFSGSDSHWHAFDDVLGFCSDLLKVQNNVRYLFLTDAHIDFKAYPLLEDKLIVKWLAQSKVSEYLQAADYGLLLRNDSQTNMVSSPVKFAEYLASGLKVLISDNIGDFPHFVENYKVGSVVRNWELKETLFRTAPSEKLRLNTLSQNHFSKAHLIKDLEEVFLGNPACSRRDN